MGRSVTTRVSARGTRARFRSFLAFPRAGRAEGVSRESDICLDPHLANTRAIGGDPSRHADGEVTTGTGVNALFVGRVAGEDLGYCQVTGAEVRAEYRRVGSRGQDGPASLDPPADGTGAADRLG